MLDEEIKKRKKGHKVLGEITDIFKRYKLTIAEIEGILAAFIQITLMMKKFRLEPFVSKERK